MQKKRKEILFGCGAVFCHGQLYLLFPWGAAGNLRGHCTLRCHGNSLPVCHDDRHTNADRQRQLAAVGKALFHFSTGHLRLVGQLLWRISHEPACRLSGGHQYAVPFDGTGGIVQAASQPPFAGLLWQRSGVFGRAFGKWRQKAIPADFMLQCAGKSDSGVAVVSQAACGGTGKAESSSLRRNFSVAGGMHCHRRQLALEALRCDPLLFGGYGHIRADGPFSAAGSVQCKAAFAGFFGRLCAALAGDQLCSGHQIARALAAALPCLRHFFWGHLRVVSAGSSRGTAVSLAADASLPIGGRGLVRPALPAGVAAVPGTLHLWYGDGSFCACLCGASVPSGYAGDYDILFVLSVPSNSTIS